MYATRPDAKQGKTDESKKKNLWRTDHSLSKTEILDHNEKKWYWCQTCNKGRGCWAFTHSTDGIPNSNPPITKHVLRGTHKNQAVQSKNNSPKTETKNVRFQTLQAQLAARMRKYKTDNIQNDNNVTGTEI